jgi:hypothetical protein
LHRFDEEQPVRAGCSFFSNINFPQAFRRASHGWIDSRSEAGNCNSRTAASRAMCRDPIRRRYFMQSALREEIPVVCVFQMKSFSSLTRVMCTHVFLTSGDHILFTDFVIAGERS